MSRQLTIKVDRCLWEKTFLLVMIALLLTVFFFLLVWGGAGDLSTSGLSPFPLKCPVWLILLLQAGFSCALAMLEET